MKNFISNKRDDNNQLESYKKKETDISKNEENEKEANKENKHKTSKKDQRLPLPMVNSPQKLSRKNFDKHKISAALLKVILDSAI